VTDVTWTLRRRLGRTFLACGLVLTGLVVVVLVLLVNFKSNGDALINRWQPAGVVSMRMLDEVSDQQTVLRAYAQAGTAEFVDGYHALVVAERRDAKLIRSAAGGDGAVDRELAEFTAAASAWQSGVAEPLISAVASHATGASAALDSPASARALARISRASHALTATIDERTSSARSARSRYATWLVVSLCIAVGLFLVIGFVLWQGLHRWVLDPVDRLRAQTRTVAGGATRRQIVADGPHEIATLGADVEAMRRQIAEQLARAEQIHDELQRRGSELSRSNADLQQFAYVASHDLSEPLRKVANFCQLLERQYGPQLDEQARQYIDFAVDGARRMQALIADLLTLSRVGRSTESFVPVDLTDAVAQAEANLSFKISEAGASIEYGRLPIVHGDPALLGSLFDNLLGNAIKYRRPDVAPVITLSAEHDSANAAWRFTLSDNGIGIEPQYAERVFAVFQRLHLRDQYDGTGIGLAICRKIVEFHGGRIWLDTTAPGPGATFRFTLPEGGAAGSAPA
jgi:signal transduction histidine kinase